MADVTKAAANRSALYYRSQRMALQRVLREQTDRRYQRQKHQVAAGYVGNGQIQVAGNRYQIEEQGITLHTGQQIIVENVGRPSAPIYVPVPQAVEV